VCSPFFLLTIFIANMQVEHGYIRHTGSIDYRKSRAVAPGKGDMVRHRDLNEVKVELFGDSFVSIGGVADTFSYNMLNDPSTYVSCKY
jgi:hypothetical protein